MWIARDRNGKLFVYIRKPIRVQHYFAGDIVGYDSDSKEYPEVTWENSPKELVVKEEESV